MASHPAFLLLTLQFATCDYPGLTTTISGPLALECVTVDTTDQERSVFLVLKIGPSFERALDPAHPVISSVDSSGVQTYTVSAPNGQAVEGNIGFKVRLPPATDDDTREDYHTFEGILKQYLTVQTSSVLDHPPPSYTHIGSSGLVEGPNAAELRGHLILVNEDSGEVLGELDDKLAIREDLSVQNKTGDVIVQLPPDGDLNGEGVVTDFDHGESGWLLRGASYVSKAIEGASHLVTKGAESASEYYISRATPHPSTIPVIEGDPKNPTKPNRAPPRLILLLTSPKTGQGIKTVHAISGNAVQISHGTLAAIDRLISRAMGNKKAAVAEPVSRTSSSTLQSNKPLLPSKSGTSTPAPTLPTPGLPPALPPREPGVTASDKLTSPTSPTTPATLPPQLPPRTKPTGMRAKVVLSADMILSALENSFTQVTTSTSNSLANAIGHKYGPQAAESTLMLTGTVRNVGLVYVDVRGVGRRAILKRAGKEFVKGRVKPSRQ